MCYPKSDAKIYVFLLRFGLANAINNYLKLRIRVVCREFLTLNAQQFKLSCQI